MNSFEAFEQFLRVELPHLAAEEPFVFDRSLGSCTQIAIYGCGNLGRKLARALQGTPMAPLAFVDGNKTLWGAEIDGLTVYSPSDGARLFGNDAALVTALWSPGKDRRFAPLKDHLQACGFQKVLPFLPLFWKYAGTLLPHYRLDLPSKALGQKDQIERAFHLLEDEPSRLEFVIQLKWMLLGDAAAVPAGDPLGDTYFPDDLFTFGEKEHFADCGAFDGDTLRNFLHRVNSVFGAVTAYEPDPGNFRKLQQYKESLPVEIQSRIRLLQCALGRERGVVRFQAMGSVSSSITATGSIEVAIQTLDESLENDVPTYIKMDIEGAEMDTLNGGLKIIREHLPKLAVCVYHLQEHLWEIPLKMNRLNPAYRLYLRRYDDEFGDVVCYALPQSKDVSA